MDSDTRPGAIVRLPGDWDREEAPFTPAPPGDYIVVIRRAVQDEPDRVSVEFQIRDLSGAAGRHLFASYVLTTPVGKRLFKELLTALKIVPRQGVLDLGALLGRSLEVTVRHNTRDDKVYANVVQHRPRTASDTP